MLDDKTIAELKKQHDGIDLEMLEHDGEQVVVRSPSEPAWQRWQAARDNQAQKSSASRNLLYDCLIWPEVSAMNAMLARRPGLVTTFGNALADMAGLAAEAKRKKL